MNRSFTLPYLFEKVLPRIVFLTVFSLLPGFPGARSINFQTIPDEVTGSWQTLATSSGIPIGREENAFVQAGTKFYLMGGRGIRAVQEYNPVTKAWVNKSNVPIELHHFQAVTIDGLIYVVGAFTGSFPREKPVPNVYIYNPVSDQWILGATIPVSRRRGSAGVVVYNKKIYVVGGILDGHWTGHVKWMDEFDPASNTWKTLDDAPRARDHFHAAVVNGKIYVAGGRRSSTSTGQTFSLTVPEVDVYNFATSSWSTLPASSNIPTPRAGSATVALGNEVLVIGGESSQPVAHKETEALNVTTNTWRRLADMNRGRHGTQAIESNNGVYIAVGAGNQGGSPLLTSHEAFYMSTATTPSGQALVQNNLTAPSSLAFGQVALPSSTAATLNLSNLTGNQAIVISSITKTGDNSFTYTAPFTLPFVIPVGGSVNFNVVFNPASTGAKSGSLAIKHSGSGQTATIALSGTAGTTGAGSSYSINAGGPAITLEGKSWAADNYFVGGKIYTNSRIGDIANTGSDQLYKTERSSATPFGYAFPVVNGTYKVDLHFAEIYWGATGGGSGGTGKRVFSVNLEGGPVELPDFDIFKEAGAMNALVRSFDVTVADGMLNIDFSVKTNQPKISAIQISPVSANAQQVTDLVLINAGNEQAIQSLTNGMTLNLNNLPANLNVQALTNPSTVGSVKFVLSGAATRNQTETQAPYALFGDTNGNYNNWAPNAGSYTLTATPYTLANGGGTAGTPRTVNLTFIKPASGNVRMSEEADAANVSYAEVSAEVFPNPADETVYIQVADWKKIKSVSINNSLGIRMFFSENMQVVSKGISVREMSAGLYLIQISGVDNKTVTKRIALFR